MTSSSMHDAESEGTVLFDRPETWYAVLQRLLDELPCAR